MPSPLNLREKFYSAYLVTRDGVLMGLVGCTDTHLDIFQYFGELLYHECGVPLMEVLYAPWILIFILGDMIQYAANLVADHPTTRRQPSLVGRGLPEAHHG